MDPLVRLSGRRGQRLGIMGGTFDPVHIGHLVTAEEARQQFSLDEIVFMPTGEPPHKSGRRITSAEDRFSMTVIATNSHPRFWVSRLEIDAPGPDYTVDTLRALRERFSEDTSLFFITGADAVLDILTWKEPERVLELCEVIAATRPGYDLERLAGLLESLPRRECVHVMEIPALAVSSSMIRARLGAGRGARYLVSDGVASFIEKAGLYGTGDGRARGAGDGSA